MVPPPVADPTSTPCSLRVGSESPGGTSGRSQGASAAGRAPPSARGAPQGRQQPPARRGPCRPSGAPSRGGELGPGSQGLTPPGYGLSPPFGGSKSFRNRLSLYEVLIPVSSGVRDGRSGESSRRPLIVRS